MQDEMAGWHHRLKRHEFEQTPGGSEGQGKPGMLSPWGHRVRHDLATEQQAKWKDASPTSRGFRLLASLPHPQYLGTGLGTQQAPAGARGMLISTKARDRTISCSSHHVGSVLGWVSLKQILR